MYLGVCNYCLNAVTSVPGSVSSSVPGSMLSLRGPLASITPDSAEVDLRTNVEAALSKEVGFIMLHLLDVFGTSFRVSTGERLRGLL